VYGVDDLNTALLLGVVVPFLCRHPLAASLSTDGTFFVAFRCFESTSHGRRFRFSGLTYSPFLSLPHHSRPFAATSPSRLAFHRHDSYSPALQPGNRKTSPPAGSVSPPMPHRPRLRVTGGLAAAPTGRPMWTATVSAMAPEEEGEAGEGGDGVAVAVLGETAREGECSWFLFISLPAMGFFILFYFDRTMRFRPPPFLSLPRFRTFALFFSTASQRACY
jgi:hypothetical protein